MTKVAVCLSGCGVFDGAEIHEAVLTLLALDRADAEILCCAPDVAQAEVVDHLRGEAVPGETRNVLVEAARIARGNIVDVATVHAADIDALIFPGGFGAAKNLCDFAARGAEAQGHPEVLRLIRECAATATPMGFLCIAPALCAVAFRDSGEQVELTIGNDEATAAGLAAMGAAPQDRAVEDILVDEAHRIVSTPAYMLAGRISEAAVGIERLVQRVLEMAREV